MTVTVELSADEARRLALSSLGFGPRPAKAGVGDLRRMAKRLNAIQIDSVNVLARAHYVPAFSRLGPYPTAALDTLAYDKRELFEYFAHAACYVPMTLHPLFRWRMQSLAHADYYAGASKQVRSYIESVYDHVVANGPVTAGELPKAGKSTGNWWGWSDGKRAIETLFRLGRVTVASRRNFARLYDIPDRVISKQILDAPTPDADDARKQLLVLAARALGVGAASDIAGYFYIDSWWDRAPVKGKRRRSELKRLFTELVEDGRLVPATVEAWTEPAYAVPRTKVPSAIHVSALVSPFDPIMWNRIPTARVFGFNYQIEIYVPQPKRIYGYYVLPFLHGDRFVGRVDLKADRKNRTLLVPAAWVESHANAKHVGAALADELRLLARWLELDEIAVGDRGDLIRPLKTALRSGARRS